MKLLAAFVVAFPVLVQAAPAPTAARPKLGQVEAYDNAANKPEPTKRLSTTIVDRAGSRFTYGTTLNYAAQQDLAQTAEPRSTTHRLMAGLSVALFDRPVVAGFDEGLAEEIVNMTVMFAGQMRTIGNEIEERQQGIVTMSDIDASLSRSIDTASVFGARSAVELALGSSFPVSEASQAEGVMAVPYASSTWALAFRGGRAVITQGIAADYTANTYLYSPVSRDINSDASVGYLLSGSVRLGYGFRLTVGGSARLVHHLDDTVTDAMANVQTLSWSHGLTTISLRHSNGSRAEDRRMSLWFIDEYRRVITLQLGVRF